MTKKEKRIIKDALECYRIWMIKNPSSCDVEEIITVLDLQEMLKNKMGYVEELFQIKH